MKVPFFSKKNLRNFDISHIYETGYQLELEFLFFEFIFELD